LHALLARADEIDKIGVGEHRRSGGDLLRDFRLILRERENHAMRRFI
jgi:hypothetical protein